MPEHGLTYVAHAVAIGRGNSPDEAIADLLDELEQPRWGLWSIFGELQVKRDDECYFVAAAEVIRTVELET
jgi:hypothetical protein